MAKYQKIEYQIGKDGKITERVIEGVTGEECLEITQEIEEDLGQVKKREFLGEYYQREENINLSETETTSLNLNQER